MGCIYFAELGQRIVRLKQRAAAPDSAGLVEAEPCVAVDELECVQCGQHLAHEGLNLLRSKPSTVAVLGLVVRDPKLRYPNGPAVQVVHLV